MDEEEPRGGDSPSPLKRYGNHLVFLGWAILLGTAISRLMLTAYLADRGYFLKYPSLAAEIGTGRLPVDRLTDVSPVYLWFVALMQGLLNVSPRSILMLQGGMAIAVAFLCGAVARRYGGCVAGFLTALFILLNRAVFVNASELEPETLILLLNAVALFLLIRKNVLDRVPIIFLGGAALGTSAATRPTALAAILLIGLWLILLVLREQRRRWAPLLSYALGAVVPIVLAMAGNFAMTGNPTFMNPGTVFYEGMNPQATGYASGEPLTVSDLKEVLPDVDAVHVGYRVVAAAATGSEATPALANSFWTGKAIGYAREFPLEAVALAVRKLGFLLHSFDAWDLSTMVRKDWAATGWIWLPFGVLAALSIPAFAQRNHLTVLVPLALYSVAVSVGPLLFYVTSRQRNPLVPAVAILAALGLLSLVSLPRRRKALLALATLTAALVLTVPGPWQEETEYAWVSLFASERLYREGHTGTLPDPGPAALRARALEATWLSGEELGSRPGVPEQAIVAAAKEVLSSEESEPRRFDAALALMRAGRWPEADLVLSQLQAVDYRPLRRAAATSSIGYYRAIAKFRTGDVELALDQLTRALREAPADPHVLALASIVLNAQEPERQLNAVHDPFIAAFARGRALLLIGDHAAAKRELERVKKSLPQWQRPDEILEDLRLR